MKPREEKKEIGWEKEFDGEFKGENEFEDGDYIIEEQATVIKQFISSLLQAERDRVLEVIDRNKYGFYGVAPESDEYEIRERINKWADDIKAILDGGNK